MKYLSEKIDIVTMNLLTNRITSIFLIFIFPLSYVSASEDVVLQKYIYGFRQYSQIEGEKYLPPVIEPLPYTDLKENGNDIKIYPYYSMSDYKNKIEKNRHQVDIHLSVQQKNSYVLATISFYNRSQQSYFVHRSRLAREKYQPLCSDTFSIATEGVSLVYLGWRCQFEDKDNDKKPDWKEIPAGKVYSYTVKLNDAYLFLPNKHRYNIGSLEFFLANNTFFHDRRVYKNMFSILSWEFTSCKVKKDRYFLGKIIPLCKNPEWKEETIEKLFHKFDYYGLSSEGYFEARSNQVVIEIDGDKLTSPYDMNMTQFSN